ncbi:MAG: nucleotidyltransferase family protein [Rhodospirillales bacterium]|jgi:MurNAc alpha-1-phosphate uridylyltransferase|nr:nucleotidyltransferase family protein [Rhodospirillales bacterium]
MVLAAGLGLRLRPITETLPKPLVEVGGRALLDRILDRLVEAGVEKVTVNLHHLGSAIEAHLAPRLKPPIEFSPEAELLETGGGVAKALPRLGEGPFWVTNGDVLWLDGPKPALRRLAGAWDDARMDALLLLHETVNAYGYQGRGDFLADPLGRLTRRPECEVAPFLFTGVQILHPRLFADAPTGPFSLNRLYDEAIEKGRLYGVVHDGEWFHVGTQEGLAEAQAYLSVRYAAKEQR